MLDNFIHHFIQRASTNASITNINNKNDINDINNINDINDINNINDINDINDINNTNNINNKNDINNTYNVHNNDIFNIFKKGEEEGCTGELEQKLINGQKFLKNDLHEINEYNNNNEKDFINLRNGQHSEYNMYMFESKGIVSNDFYRILYECAQASSAKPYLVDVCVNKYFKKYKIKFSQTCLSCFSTFIGCTFISCNKECSKNQCNDECKVCSDSHCFKKLLECTKLEALPDPCK
ncbi:conserved Plasmodium protein, unknown function [Plasmodium gaboni]|uniref:TNFR-Cys domain-containing protein n=1 Tax=Plasmodium gaboni TaxID=647221 RepID=A0ABY1UNG2_9APIC|nr:conserved Plasmodium protein, unknown function [Plasmodium gaboni]